MKYPEVLNYLYTSLPVYQKTGGKAIKIDLGNIRKLCAALDNPERDLQVIHIAGTNGKGSVSHMLAAILTEAGYRTGLYTSPHFLDFRERIRIDGECISQEEVVDFVLNNKELFEEIKPSFFEMTVAMAFHHFRTENIDFAVIETGLGGRLDSTNIVDPLVAVITNISYDHQEFLGDTLQEIAGEKAGIIKSKKPTIIGVRNKDYFAVIEQAASDQESMLRVAAEEIEIHILERDSERMRLALHTDLAGLPTILSVPFSGIYQTENLATVLCCIDQLRKTAGLIITEENISVGLESLGRKNYFPGRWQLLQMDPKVIADSAHNLAGVNRLLDNIAQEPYQDLHFVIGFSKGKDFGAILDRFPSDAHFYFCCARIHRALPLKQLRAYSEENNLSAEFHEEVGSAFHAALAQANPNDLILITGSIFVVADLMMTEDL